MDKRRVPSKFFSQRLVLGLLGLSLVMMIVLLMANLQEPGREAAQQNGEPLAQLGLLPSLKPEPSDPAP